MKKTKLSLIVLGAALLGSSCYKKFDESSYQPPLDIGGFSNSKEIAPANLVGYWAFNGSLIDSVGGASGTNTGTSFSTGVKGQSLQGALNSYVLATPSTAVSGMHSFTMTYWVNSAPPSTGIIGMVSLAKTDGFWGNIETFFENGSTNTNGRFRAHIQNGPTDAWISKDNIVNMHDKWTAIAISYDQLTGTFKLHVNGGSVYTNIVAGFGPINFTNVGKLVFGCVQFQTTPSQTSATGAQGWASYLTGRLDEVRIYNKALNDNEINSLVLLEGRGK